MHFFTCRGDLAAVQRILPRCLDESYILKKSEVELTKGLDALHTALIFQQLDIADAIMERLGELWSDSGMCTLSTSTNNKKLILVSNVTLASHVL